MSKAENSVSIYVDHGNNSKQKLVRIMINDTMKLCTCKIAA